MKNLEISITRRTVSRKTDFCTSCGAECKRHSTGRRRIRTLFGVTVVVYSKH